MRRIDIVSVKVWLLRRWRLAQGFLSHLCLRILAPIGGSHEISNFLFVLDIDPYRARSDGAARLRPVALKTWRPKQELFFGGAMRERVRIVVAGFFIGGFLGWFMGFAWYEFIEVPKAASMNSMAAENYLCAAAIAMPLLAVPGGILGAVVGLWKK